MKIFDFLQYYDGTIRVNGQEISQEQRAHIDEMGDELKIELIPKNLVKQQKFRLRVRKWLLNAEFDFNVRWNNGTSIPCDTGTCTLKGSTPGMWIVDFIGDNGVQWSGYVSKAGVISMEEIEE